MQAKFDGRSLSQVIGEQVDTAISSLKALDVPLEDALASRPEQVKVAYDALQKLLRLVVADLTSQLSISLVFSDNDGD